MEKNIKIKKGYTEIKVPITTDLDDALSLLAKYALNGHKGYINFNDHIIYTDISSLENAYVEVVGTTREEWKAYQKKMVDEAIEQAEKSRKSAIENIPNWIEQGNKLIFKPKQKEWAKLVNMVANESIYYGHELDSALKIMSHLDETESVVGTEEIIRNQDHSGYRYDLTSNIVLEFAHLGPEFYEAINNGQLNKSTLGYLEMRKSENRSILSKQHSKTQVKKVSKLAEAKGLSIKSNISELTPRRFNTFKESLQTNTSTEVLGKHSNLVKTKNLVR